MLQIICVRDLQIETSSLKIRMKKRLPNKDRYFSNK